jgi:hypothetical protein
MSPASESVRDQLCSSSRLSHKPIRTPVHQLGGGITRADDTHPDRTIGRTVNMGGITDVLLPPSLEQWVFDWFAQQPPSNASASSTIRCSSPMPGQPEVSRACGDAALNCVDDVWRLRSGPATAARAAEVLSAPTWPQISPSAGAKVSLRPGQIARGRRPHGREFGPGCRTP